MCMLVQGGLILELVVGYLGGMQAAETLLLSTAIGRQEYVRALHHSNAWHSGCGAEPYPDRTIASSIVAGVGTSVQLLQHASSPTVLIVFWGGTLND